MIRTSSVQTETERDNDEMELQWAAIERLPTMKRVRMSLFDNQMQETSKQVEEESEEKKGKRIIDVTKLTPHEKHVFIDKLINNVQEDDAGLLLKMKQRIDMVGVKLPAVEAIPKWWVLFYWISPSAWLLNSYITSQYGDIKQQINSFGKPEAIDSFLEDYYGYYNHDRLGLVAVVTATFPLVAVVLFACFIRMLNFQRR